MKKKRRTKSGKGSSGERKFAKLLSLWWTGGKRDDVFWRSDASGGRASVRSKQRKTTQGHYGDICASDPIGAPLIDLMTIECKNGYRETHASGLLDKPNSKGQYELEKWFEKAESTWKESGSVGWCVIHLRKGRAPTIYLPKYLYEQFCVHGCFWPIHYPNLNYPAIQFTWGEKFNKIVALRFDTFLKLVSPSIVKQMAKVL